MADNGLQVFIASDIEKVLSHVFDYDYSGGSRKNRYSDQEICDMHEISSSELDRMKDTLSYSFNHDIDGKYKF